MLSHSFRKRKISGSNLTVGKTFSFCISRPAFLTARVSLRKWINHDILRANTLFWYRFARKNMAAVSIGMSTLMSALTYFAKNICDDQNVVYYWNIIDCDVKKSINVCKPNRSRLDMLKNHSYPYSVCFRKWLKFGQLGPVNWIVAEWDHIKQSDKHTI